MVVSTGAAGTTRSCDPRKSSGGQARRGAGADSVPSDSGTAASPTPIYDALERLWLQRGREVPNRCGPGQAHDDGDLFRRA